MVNSVIDCNTITNPQQGSGIALVGAVTHTEVAYNTLRGNAGSFTGINLLVSDVASGGAYNVAHDPSGAAIPNSGDKIMFNNVSGWGDSGIRLRDATHDVLVLSNTVTGNGTANAPTTGDGISIENSYSNCLYYNCVDTNRRNGIFLTNAQANTIDSNTATNNGGDGILVSAGSAGNTISCNTANHNGDFVAGTGDGVHLVDSNNNLVINNTAKNNAHDGLHVAGTSTGNTLMRNTAKNNGNYDLEDDSTGVNTWFHNTAGKYSRNPATLG
jgi:parallel beta-helix repeat protein